MSNSHAIELYKQLSVAQDKYIYFLLAASASAIGFAMTQTKAEALSLVHIPLGLSVLGWVISFYSGLKVIESTNNSIKHNFNEIQFKDNLQRYQQDENVLKFIKRIDSDTKEAIDGNNKKVNIYIPLQSYSLITGAFFYIIWHIIRMYNYVPCNL